MFGVELRIAHRDTGDTRLARTTRYRHTILFLHMRVGSNLQPAFCRSCDTRYRIRRIELAERERIEEERDQN